MKEKGRLEMSAQPGWKGRMIGHFRTIAPTVRHEIGALQEPASVTWRTKIPNEFGEEITHSGRFCDVAGEDTLVVILHGLGGSVSRGYCLELARASYQKGMPTLRISLRGADGLGRDFHHAGFTDDLGPLLRKPEWDRFKKIAFVGFSLGGHVALRAAVEEVDPRIAAVAAICPPLDLRASQESIDSPSRWIYRQSVLRSLKKIYPRMIRGRSGMTPASRVQQVQTLREWDALTVVPRFGFRDVDHYYRSQSVGPDLAQMKKSSLIVASPADPMIPADSLRGSLARASDPVEVRWVKGGGHVFFPPHSYLGFGEELGVPAQVVHWINERLR